MIFQHAPDLLHIKLSRSLVECATNCQNAGYKGVAGTENGEECWCSDATTAQGEKASPLGKNQFVPRRRLIENWNSQPDFLRELLDDMRKWSR